MFSGAPVLFWRDQNILKSEPRLPSLPSQQGQDKLVKAAESSYKQVEWSLVTGHCYAVLSLVYILDKNWATRLMARIWCQMLPSIKALYWKIMRFWKMSSEWNTRTVIIFALLWIIRSADLLRERLIKLTRITLLMSSIQWVWDLPVWPRSAPDWPKWEVDITV